jgi:hypothetical protein
MNDKSERMWKGTSEVYFILSQHLPGNTEKNHEKIGHES